jgi:hypothetical protein
MLLHSSTFPRSGLTQLLQVHDSVLVTREYCGAIDNSFVKEFLLGSYSAVIVDCTDTPLSEASRATFSLLSRLVPVVLVAGEGSLPLPAQRGAAVDIDAGVRVIKGFPRDDAVRFALAYLFHDISSYA